MMNLTLGKVTFFQSIVSAIKNRIDRSQTKFECCCVIAVVILIAIAVVIVVAISAWLILTKGAIFKGKWYWGWWRASIWAYW